MPDIQVCPECGQPVQPGWKACPMCMHSLRDDAFAALTEDVVRTPATPQQPTRKRRWNEPIPVAVPYVEKDVKTDTTIIGVILLALGGLGLIGIFLYLMNASSKNPPSPGGILVVGVAVVLVVSVGVALMTRRSGPGVSTAVGIATGLATGGMIAAVVAVVVMMIVAASILNFCFTCGGLAK